ncbi:class I SAM-dependent methyltransferase [Rhodanobacter sp. MP1X3]|uniref:class I SAM-dependent methyltransferase n=1 Tax=Rhodanobacter sp. MP1X3 TaxID=2723086 RepID=UPI00161E1C6D|nr:class I SAM-dependent methyltransferase [Rhodanobacter sp. MP1X3]MBB6243291.1 SAM-dependent methyltransferase [Rhodanobacter sp. MP1X3]
MDGETIKAYDNDASHYADDWLAQPEPTDLYGLLTQYFTTGKTADIGCGAGRDTAWLASHGYDAAGFDASDGLLDEARRRHPHLAFGHAILPALDGVERGVFQNVLCETVIMHLPPEQISEAVSQLFGLLIPGGVLALSWRITEDDSRRDDHGRLYSAFDKSSVLDICADYEVLMESENINLSSQKKIHRIVVRKTA